MKLSIRLPVTIAAALFVGLPNACFSGNDESGVFVDESAIRLPQASNAAVRAGIGDLDGDGDLDIVVASGSYTDPNLVSPQDFLLQINDSHGVFIDEATYRLPSTAFATQVASSAVLGDVDGDGDVDIFVTNGFSGIFQGTLDVFQNLLWINDSTGSFTDETTSRLPAATNSSFHAAFGDMDGDKDLDLIVGNVGIGGRGQQNRILINDGRGKFTDETVTRLPTLEDITLAVAVQDIDMDSDLDIVVANRTSGSRILINNGSGIFGDESATRLLPRAPSTGDVKISDINSDGAPDILFASLGGGPLIFVNNGTGIFTDETSSRIPTFRNTHGLSFADVDVDGAGDLFASIPESQNRLFLNNGAGIFTDISGSNLPATDTDVVRYPSCGDFDGDGDPDFYLPVWFNNQTTSQDRILINKGDSITLIEDLIDKVIALNLNKGTTKSLLAKLNSALKKLQKNNPSLNNGTTGVLNSFIKVTRAKTPKQIDPEDSDELITDAERLLLRVSKMAECIN